MLCLSDSYLTLTLLLRQFIIILIFSLSFLLIDSFYFSPFFIRLLNGSSCNTSNYPFKSAVQRGVIFYTELLGPRNSSAAVDRKRLDQLTLIRSKSTNNAYPLVKNSRKPAKTRLLCVMGMCTLDIYTQVS